MGDISGTAAAIATKNIPPASLRQVESGSRKARGWARRFSRYRVHEVEGRGRSGLPSKTAPSWWAPDVKSDEG
ncbi:hypothetical protein PISMIDRAFT_684181, partial [Pisolithus microcarpus 441]